MYPDIIGCMVTLKINLHSVHQKIISWQLPRIFGVELFLGMNLPCAPNEANYIRSLVRVLRHQSPSMMDLDRDLSSTRKL